MQMEQASKEQSISGEKKTHGQNEPVVRLVAVQAFPSLVS